MCYNKLNDSEGRRITLFKRYFCPDWYFELFDDVTPDFLTANGIRALILDIDNTLAPYEEPDPNPRVLAWFSALKENGIVAAFVSISAAILISSNASRRRGNNGIVRCPFPS